MFITGYDPTIEDSYTKEWNQLYFKKGFQATRVHRITDSRWSLLGPTRIRLKLTS